MVAGGWIIPCFVTTIRGGEGRWGIKGKGWGGTEGIWEGDETVAYGFAHVHSFATLSCFMPSLPLFVVVVRCCFSF